jgi:hypothetical protein
LENKRQIPIQWNNLQTPLIKSVVKYGSKIQTQNDGNRRTGVTKMRTSLHMQTNMKYINTRETIDQWFR